MAGAQAEPYRIGVLTDMSGMNYDLSGKGSEVAAQMAVEDFGGKLLGEDVEVIVGDHQNKPDVGSTLARRWIDEQNVIAIADVPTSSVALAVQEITRQSDTALLISTAGSSALTGASCFAVDGPVDLGHLCAGQRNRPRDDAGGRQEVVFPDRRLYLRPRA